MASRVLGGVTAASRSIAQPQSASASRLGLRWISGKRQSESAIAIANQALRYRLSRGEAAPQQSWSPQAAVSNILYETPVPAPEPTKRHILNVLVQDDVGIIARVSSILAARGFNIQSMVACGTGVSDLARINIVLIGHDGVVEQARRQLEDMVPVWAVLNFTEAPLIQRELLLAKVNILGPEYFEELLAHHRELANTHAEDGEEVNLHEQSLEDVAENFHPSQLAASEALRQKHEHLDSITYFAKQFGGRVLDISSNSCTVEL
jgi:acetolactate synthase-1/3 small subunit